MPQLVLTTPCCNYSFRTAEGVREREGQRQIGKRGSLQSSGVESTAAKIRKRFMNAHMRNGTSLRAIHNKIRVVPGQASTRYPHWSLTWLTDLGMRLGLGLRLRLGLGFYLHWEEAAGAGLRLLNSRGRWACTSVYPRFFSEGHAFRNMLYKLLLIS